MTRTPRPSRSIELPERAAEGVAGVHGGRRPVLLGHVHRERAVGGGLAQRLDLRAELLDGQLDLVDAVLHDQHLVDGVGLLEEPDEPPLDGPVVAQAGLQVDVLRGDVLTRGGRGLHVSELGEPLDGGVEQRLGDADDEAGVGIRAERGVRAGARPGALRAAVGGGGGVQRHGLRRAAGLRAHRARHDVAVHGRRHRLDAVDVREQRAAGDEERHVPGAHQVVGGRCRRPEGRPPRSRCVAAAPPPETLLLAAPSVDCVAPAAGRLERRPVRSDGSDDEPERLARAAAAGEQPYSDEKREHADDGEWNGDSDLDPGSHGFLLPGRAPAAG